MSMFDVSRVSAEVGEDQISFETGKLARQASGAVVVQSGDTMVLCTATMGNLRDVDFLPLTVDVEERMYAAGKIPGSFFRREGRSGEKATLTARMIDRPIRPLFPKGWHYETQLVATPLSVDHVHPYDILAMNGASAALAISPVPVAAHVGAVRVGKLDGDFVVNPPEESLEELELDLIVAGTDEAILMVEAGADGVTEAEILDALDIAHSEIKKLVAAMEELQQKAGKEKIEVEAPSIDESLLEEIRSSLRRQDRRGDLDQGEARPPGRGRRGQGGGPRGPRPGRRGRRARRGPPRRGQGGLLEHREGHHPQADRGRQEAPRRPRPGRDPADRVRGRHLPARARLGALHPRRDADPLQRRARHDADGHAPRHARAADHEALLAPLQLPALLGRGGGLHARPEAPRHRPRRARRAGAGAVDPRRRGLPLRDPGRLGDARVQRLLLDGLGLRLLDGAAGGRRAGHRAGRRRRDGPDQGGRRLHRPHRHRRRRGPPRRHGLQGRRHRGRDHRPADGHQDHRRHLRDPRATRSRRPTRAASSSSARWPRRSTARARCSPSTRRGSKRSRSTRRRSAP